METSLFIARVIGPVMFVVGLGLLLKPKRLKIIIKDLAHSSALVYFMGFMITILGMSLVLVHNIWVTDWRLMITILAWSTLLKGLLYTLFPDSMLGVAEYFAKKNLWAYTVIAVVFATLFGIYFTYFGYFAPMA